MDTARLQTHEWNAHRSFFPFLLEKEELSKKEIGKIELFEAGLENELKKTDSVEVAVRKIVRMALAAEFGASLVKSKGAEGMVETIVRGIMSDNTLRKQALFIMNRFAK